MSDETTAAPGQTPARPGVQVDALVGKVGEPTHDKRTIADLAVHSDPLPVRLPGGALGMATADITGDGVIAHLTLPPELARELLAGKLHAHMDTEHDRIVTGGNGRMTLLGGRLRGLTLSEAPPAWDGTWVAPVREERQS